MIGMDEILMTLVLERIDDKFSKKKNLKIGFCSLQFPE